MKASLLLVLSLTGLCLLVTAARDDKTESETGPARLLIEKKILNKYLVEGKDIVVHYHVYNVGKTAASDIQVSDPSLDPQYFSVASGVSSFSISKLESGENVTHTVVYQPKQNVWGQFNFTSAVVTYNDGFATQSGLTSEPGQGFIVTQKDFERRFSSHALDWIAFVLMTLPCLLLPFLLWHRSKAKYEGSAAAAKHVNKTK